MEEFGKFMFGLILIGVAILIGGFVFFKMWNWLLVPSLDVIELNYTSGVAISTFLIYIKYKVPKEEEEPSIKESLEAVGKALLHSGFLLLIGWVVSLFI